LVIADDWGSPAIDALPPAIAALARQWPDGAYAAEAEAFAARWRAKGVGRGGRKTDWAAAWAARVAARHEAVMRMARAGTRWDDPAAAGAGHGAQEALTVTVSADKAAEDGRSADLHAGLRGLEPSDWNLWWSRCALLLVDDVLTVSAPSDLVRSRTEAERAALERALSLLGWHVDGIVWCVRAPAGSARLGGAQRSAKGFDGRARVSRAA
jgi:hypothetical protein